MKIVWNKLLAVLNGFIGVFVGGPIHYTSFPLGGFRSDRDEQLTCAASAAPPQPALAGEEVMLAVP